MSLTVPKTMKALVLEEYGKPLQLKEVPIPKLKKNEVLIKIECSPLNPMDLSFIKGSYSSVKKLPATPGFEASGTVVASGGNIFKAEIKNNIMIFFKIIFFQNIHHFLK